MEFWTFMTTNMEALAGLVVGLIGLIKVSSWGKAKSEALDTIVSVIETLGLSEAKTAIAAQNGQISQGAQDAIHHAVNKADAKKRPVAFGERLVGELLRGVLRKS